MPELLPLPVLLLLLLLLLLQPTFRLLSSPFFAENFEEEVREKEESNALKLGFRAANFGLGGGGRG